MTNATMNEMLGAGNPHVAPTLGYGGTGRFDEGEVAPGNPRRGSLLYKSYIAFAAVTFVCCVRAEATTAYFTETSTSATTTLQWMGSTYWADADGNALGYAPTNGETIVFRDLPTSGTNINGLRVQTAKDGDMATRKQNYSFSSLTGDVRHIIRHSAKLKNENSGSDQRLTVTDPNGFLGHWEAGGPHAVISLPGNGESDFVPTLGNLNVRNRPVVEVPADVTAAVTTLDGMGMMEKFGAGTLEITAAGGADAGVYLSSGKLSLNGGDETELAKLLSQSAFHLDATDVDSVVTSNDTETGCSWVMRWNDVRPANTEYYVYGAFGVYSTASHLLPDMRPAFISKTDAPTGKRLVSFGSNIAHYDPVNMGPTNCILRFNKDFKNIREVFYAVETPYGANYNVGILGYSTDSYSMWNANTHLFGYGSDSYGQRAIAYGEVSVNGEYKPLEDIDATNMKDFFTVGLGLANDAQVNLLGSSRGYRDYSCGSRMGELLFFTNVLTRAQRALINNYLNAKWRTGAGADVGEVVASISSAEIEVPAGRTASVQDVVTAKDGELVKTGAGKLTMDSIASTGDVKVRVEGGSIAFARTLAAPATNAPAVHPWIWLDATASSCYDDTTSTYFPDTTFVTKWYDCRADKRDACYASCFTEQYSPGTKDITATVARIPTVATWAGKRVFDFGSQWDATLKNRASFKLSNWQTAAADGTYAAFVVIRPKTTTSYEPIFGSYNYSEGVPRREGVLAHPTMAQGHALAARWAVNGVKCDPSVAHPKLAQTQEFFVLSVSGGQPFTFESIFQDRWPGADDFAYSTTAGQFQIGEVLAYYRPLNEREVRETEAYLMGKWLGASHPAAKTIQIDKLTFADGVAPNVEVGAGVEVKVSSFESPSGMITKTGDGKLTVAEIAPPDLATYDGLTVDGTDYTIDCSGEPESDRLISVRFDPNATGKLTTTEVEEGGGSKRIELKHLDEADGRLVWDSNAWRSYRLTTRGCATAGVRDNVTSFTNPTVQTVSFPVGERKVIDFGLHSGYYKKDQNQLASAAYVNRPYSGAKTLDMRDSFIVWCDTHDAGYAGNGTVFFGNGLWQTSFYSRGKNWSIGGHSFVANGYISLDGAEVPSTTSVPEGFHLLSFSPTNTTKFSLLANQDNGNNSLGGCSVGEVIVFTNALPRAMHRYVAARLMKKWFGQNMMTNVVDVGSMTLKNGGTLRVVKNAEADGTSVNCPALAGDGTVDADEVDGISSIAVAFHDKQIVDRLTVTGAAKLADTGTLTVTVPAGVNVGTGEYTLFEAERLVGSLAGWNVVLDGSITKHWSVQTDGSAIKLVVRPAGVSIIIR